MVGSRMGAYVRVVCDKGCRLRLVSFVGVCGRVECRGCAMVVTVRVVLDDM